jgi:hypothetical protein
LEGRAARHQHVQDHAQAPDVWKRLAVNFLFGFFLFNS